MAGVVYMNDSVIGTALGSPSARAEVTPKAINVKANVLKGFMLWILTGWNDEWSNKMLIRDNNQ
jgi:hypothetical protein